MTNASSSFSTSFSTSSMEEAFSTPSTWKSELRVSTMCLLFGRTLPMLSKVFLPMMMVCPSVIFLKCLRSFGRCQRSPFSLPIMLFLPTATTMLSMLHCDLHLYLAQMLVIIQLDVIGSELVEVLDLGIDNQLWCRKGFFSAGKLKL